MPPRSIRAGATAAWKLFLLPGDADGSDPGKVLTFSVLIRLTETLGPEKIFVLLKVKDHIYFKMGFQLQSDVSVRLGEDEERTRRSK